MLHNFTGKFTMAACSFKFEKFCSGFPARSPFFGDYLKIRRKWWLTVQKSFFLFLRSSLERKHCPAGFAHAPLKIAVWLRAWINTKNSLKLNNSLHHERPVVILNNVCIKAHCMLMECRIFIALGPWFWLS